MLHSIRVFIISSISFTLVFTTTLLNVDFETEGSGYSAPSTEGTGFTDIFNRTDYDLGGNATFKWAFEDITANASLALDQIDVSGLAQFTFSIDLLAHHYNDWDGGSSGDKVEIFYSLDGAEKENLMWILALDSGESSTANEPAALDTDFDGVAECAHVLPALSTGSNNGSGCAVTSNLFQTFTTDAIDLNGASTLDITLDFTNFTSGDEGGYLDNIVVSSVGDSSADGGDGGGTVDPCEDVTCPAASGDCYVAGSCDSAGTCSDETMADDGTACDDGDDATTGDSCTAGVCAGTVPPPAANLFISEWAEGTSNNKYFEVYNASTDTVDLSDYEFVTCSNACDNDTYEYNTSFSANVDGSSTLLAAGDVYVVCHGSASDGITAECDQTNNYVSNGDDALGLWHTAGNQLLDVVGLTVNYSNSGWTVAGVSGATKDDTIVRKASVTQGNTDWASSAGTDTADSEWLVEAKPEATYTPPTLGNHTFGVPVCGDNASGDSNVNWGNLQWPSDMTLDAGSNGDAYGQAFISGVTPTGGSDSNLEAQLGYGASGSTPDDSWTWVAASHHGTSGNNDEYKGVLNIADAGTYSYSFRYSYNSDCWYYASEVGTATINALATYAVTFNVDMNYRTVSDTGVDLFGPSGFSTAIDMTDDNADGVYSVTLDLTAGTYLYKFKNGTDSSDWEFLNDLSCAYFDDPDGDGWGYWNRTVTVTDAAVDIVADCFNSCGACVSGCTDENATNYDSTANVDDGNCEYPQTAPPELLFSEYAEGSGVNKYLEIYNPSSDETVSLDDFKYATCANACSDDTWEYADAFAEGASIAPGDVYVLCHEDATWGICSNGSSTSQASCLCGSTSNWDETTQSCLDASTPTNTWTTTTFVTDNCDEQRELYFNGNDAQGLLHSSTNLVVDVIGVLDNSTYWQVGGEDSNGALRDNTIVRKSDVTTGNPLWLDNVDPDTGEVLDQGSAGSSSEDSEWILLPKDTWTFVGSHPNSVVFGCTDSSATNHDSTANVDDGSCEYPCDDVDEDDVCDDVDDCVGAYDECNVCNGTGPQEGFNCAGEALINVTFNVDMSTFTVDTAGYGLDLLVVDQFGVGQNGWHDLTDDDGDDVWSVTVSLVGNATYQYKFKNGDDWDNVDNQDCAVESGGFWNRTVTLEDYDVSLATVCFKSCTACPTCSDGTQNGDETGVDCGGSCADACATCDDGTQNQDETGVDCGGATCSACCANDGNVNSDDKVNIADIVQMVDWILNDATQVTENLCSGDIDLDGTITVADLVAVVNIILDVRAYNVNQLTPSYADIILTKDSISLRSDGNVSGVQVTLSHGSNFNFNIEDEFVSEYQTSNGKTTIVMISETGSLANIGTYNGSCNVDSFMAVDANAQIIDDADLVLDFDPVELKLAGPNPFNPTTSLNVVVAEAGHVSVNVYNVVGQKVATLLNDYLNINTSGYTVNWDASNLSSGVYLVRAETANSISTQKLMLLK